MKASRFYRLVWRANGVLVLLTFLSIGGAALFAAASTLVRELRRDDAPAAVATSSGDDDAPRLFFDDLVALDGTPHVVLPLRASEASSYSSGETSVTRNLLFFDTLHGTTRWLRPDHEGAVVTWELVRDADRDDAPPAQVRAIRYELATADTDGDGEITEDDARQIAVSGPAGDDLAIVLGDLDAILGYADREDTLFVFFRRGEKDLVAEVDLRARKLRRTSPLPRT